MSKHHDKPGSPGDILKHHGVKGMKWGVRNDDITSGLNTAKSLAGTNNAAKAYMAAASTMAAKPVSEAQQEINLKANRERFLQKFEPSEAPDGKMRMAPSEKPDPGAIAQAKEKWNALTPEQKHKLKVVGAYGALGVGVIGFSIYANRYSLPASSLLDMSGAEAGAGQKLGLGQFLNRINKSQAATMRTENFFRPESFSRPGFELPAGHTFSRISSAAEQTFGQATYCSANEDDFNRYAVALGVSGVKRHVVTFKSTAPVKVPSLTDVLETVKEVRETKGFNVSEENVLTHYKNISHAQWKDPKSLELINALKKKGFGAIVDEMDSGVFSDKPLVLFSGDVTPKSAKALTRKELMSSLSALKEISNPPGRKL